MADHDWKLLAQFSQDKNHTAFTTLVQRHRRLVQATCRRILGDAGDAEDAVQSTFFRLARNAEELTRDSRPQRSLPAWLCRVATNICLDTVRSRAARRNREQEYMRQRTHEKAPPTTELLLPLVDELIDELPQKYREPIVLCYLQGKQHSRAATELGITVATIRRRIQSAKSLLRSRFAGRGIPVSMFLLHILMDNLATGAESIPASGCTAPPISEPPAPVTPSPSASIRPASQAPAVALSGAGSWAVLLGLIAVVGTVGLVTTLYSSPDEEDATQRPVIADREQADIEPAIVVPMPAVERPVDPDAIAAASSRPAEPVQEPLAALPTRVAEPEFDLVSQLTSSDGTSEKLLPQPEIQLAESVTVSLVSDTSSRDVEQLFGIDWHTTLESAQATAGAEPARPILCFRVLGELSGFM